MFNVSSSPIYKEISELEKQIVLAAFKKGQLKVIWQKTTGAGHIDSLSRGLVQMGDKFYSYEFRGKQLIRIKEQIRNTNGL